MTNQLDTLFTLGVYGYTEDVYFRILVKNEIDLFIDIRARRGMRGSQYKFANSRYLQSKLDEMGIAYTHLPDLAPSKEIRALQYLADQENETAKRNRTELSKGFVKAYKRDILKVFKRKPEHKFYAEDMLARARELSGFPPKKPLRRVALFCVEREPSACHRSLLADELRKQLGVTVEHI